MQHCSGTWCSEMRHENHSWWPCGISRGILGKRLISGVVVDLLGYCWGSMDLMKLMQIASHFKTYYLVNNFLLCIPCFWSEWGHDENNMISLWISSYIWKGLCTEAEDCKMTAVRFTVLRPRPKRCSMACLGHDLQDLCDQLNCQYLVKTIIKTSTSNKH